MTTMRVPGSLAQPVAAPVAVPGCDSSNYIGALIGKAHGRSALRRLLPGGAGPGLTAEAS